MLWKHFGTTIFQTEFENVKLVMYVENASVYSHKGVAYECDKLVISSTE